MKKIIFALFTVAFVTSICFAEEASVPSSTDNSANPTQVSSATVVPTQLSGTTTSPTPAGTTTFTGKVDSVSSGSSMTSPNPQIIVKDDQGLGTAFMVASDATIIGKNGDSTTLDWMSKGDKVSIEYITNQDGTKTAKSIKVSADF